MNYGNVLITGVAGFIGSNLAEHLLDTGNVVIGMDRSPPTDPMLKHLLPRRNFHYVSRPVNNLSFECIRWPVDFVFHLAAKADIRFSVANQRDDFSSFKATCELLHWMKEREIKKIAFTSSAAVYGEPVIVPIPEDYAPTQTSFYGASKYAGEAWIQAHCEAHDCKAWIFRLVSILGPGYSHGFAFNFYKQLKENPDQLYVHGSPEQKRSYLWVHDLIRAFDIACFMSHGKVSTFNVGHDEVISLDQSIPIITKHMQINPKIIWSGNEVGWIGDSKTNLVNTHRLKTLGWNPSLTIEQCIQNTLRWFDLNPWVLSRGEQ